MFRNMTTRRMIRGRLKQGGDSEEDEKRQDDSEEDEIKKDHTEDDVQGAREDDARKMETRRPAKRMMQRRKII